MAIGDIFAAGEAPIVGASRDDLVDGLLRHGHRDARALASEDALEALVRAQAAPGDIVVCLGAGTISAWANRLPGPFIRVPSLRLFKDRAKTAYPRGSE